MAEGKGAFRTAGAQDLKRLLELFPLATLREAWPDIKGTKEEICFAAAEGRDYDKIAAFIESHFSCCRQHVYAFTNAADGLTLPSELLGEPAASVVAGTSALFVLRVRYNVVLRDPLEETFIDFLWPIRIEAAPDKVHSVLRFVVLEKAVTYYFDRPCYASDRSIEERNVLGEIEPLCSARADLHKGVKELWKNGFMDSSHAKLKKTLSMVAETMDEELGIREHNPELYAQALENTMLNVLFSLADEPAEKLGVSVLSVQPSAGYIAFPRYSAKGGTDFVVSEILKLNQ